MQEKERQKRKKKEYMHITTNQVNQSSIARAMYLVCWENFPFFFIFIIYHGGFAMMQFRYLLFRQKWKCSHWINGMMFQLKCRTINERCLGTLCHPYCDSERNYCAASAAAAIATVAELWWHCNDFFSVWKKKSSLS